MARGTVDRRDNGRYRARYTGPDGRWYSQTFDRKVDADRWLTDQLARLNGGRWIDPGAGQVTFGRFAEDWLRSKTRIKRKTHDTYRSLLDSRILPTFGDVRIGSIDRPMVSDWIRAMTSEGLSPSRIRQAHQCLAAILEMAVDDAVIGRNPARRVELPRIGQPEHRFLTESQVDRLADSMPDHQHRTIVYLLAYRGLRWGEMAALRRQRVDVLGHRLDIAEAVTEISGELVFGAPKTHQSRTVHLPRFVAELLGHHFADVAPAPEAFVFTAPRGGPLRYGNVRRTVWNPARSLAGSDLEAITPHDLRHTCASLMRAAGADVKAIQQQLGHRNATVTLNTYTHLFEGDLDDVMSRLDRQVPVEGAHIDVDEPVHRLR